MTRRLCLFALLAASWYTGAQTPPAQPNINSAPLDRDTLLVLLRQSLLALDDANRTGNYTVLRDLGSPAFQVNNTAARLSEVFASLRQKNVDLSRAAVLEPQWTAPPEIRGNGQLYLAGFYPAGSLRAEFDIVFEPVNNHWRVFGLSVYLVQPTPKH